MTKDTDKDTNEGKVFAMVSYWFFLCILPLILKKDNKFAVYHGKQGLVLFIALVVVFILSIIPFFGPLLFRTLFFVYLLIMLWGTIQVLRGKYIKIPVVSDIAKKINL